MRHCAQFITESMAVEHMGDTPIIVWFRNDLRLSDNSALTAALTETGSIVPVYVLDDDAAGPWRAGAASRWWLHHSLDALSQSIRERGGTLILRRGASADVLLEIAKVTGASAIYFSRAYEPWAIRQETGLKDRAGAAGLKVRRFAGALLSEPENIRNKSGEPYRVYTPFWRAIAALGAPPRPLPPPDHVPVAAGKLKSEKLSRWGFLPSKPDWSAGLTETWQPGEAGAEARLSAFLARALRDYADARNFPARDATSRLSPHLHCGEISPRQIWHRAAALASAKSGHDRGLETFLKELVWREFSYHLLFHWPDLPERAFRPEFESFGWRQDDMQLRAWQKGLTGYPIVDAGMRELWRTGTMHNRVRMITASFLVKHLLIPWQAGEAWFWDTLVDADLASNSASWQWVAGSGADAAPYFRIFNPMLQGQKFDPEGAYVRRWVPELGGLDARFIHAPWTAPEAALSAAGLRLGHTYPFPMVDHAIARERALQAFSLMNGASASAP